MKEKLKLLITFIFICAFYAYGENVMNKINFEPEIFDNLKYDWNEYIWDETENICCNKIFEINKISINLPSKISANNNIKKVPLPICISYYITEKRICKYNEKEFQLTLHIKQITDNKNTEWINYPIEKKEFINYSMQEMINLPPDFDETENRRNQLTEQYKCLPDNKLNDGYVYGGNITFNISDYLSFPLTPGKYDIYISRNNIESEHKVISIIYE